MALQAYQKAQRAAENPRSAEYRLFGQVTGALLDAQNTGAKGVGLIDATWPTRLPPSLGARLQELLDDPNG